MSRPEITVASTGAKQQQASNGEAMTTGTGVSFVSIAIVDLGMKSLARAVAGEARGTPDFAGSGIMSALKVYAGQCPSAALEP